MEPTGTINSLAVCIRRRIGSALFHQRPGTEARISALSPPLPFAATPPGTGESGVGLFLNFMSTPMDCERWTKTTWPPVQ
jgi:hypothetical protein